MEERQEVLFGIATVFPKQQKSRLELVAEHEELTLHGWQTDVLSILSRSAGPRDRRLIDVIVDKYDGGMARVRAFIDTLNFTWLHLIESRQGGRFASRLRSSIPELYRCPRCGHRYPHVCGTEWDRQSYLDMASGRNAEKQISHVKLLKKEKGKGNEELKF